jgi:hypothetical protein
MVLDGGSPAEYEFYFTGAHFGLFNQTVDGENGLCPAHFGWASFEEGDIEGGATVPVNQAARHQGKLDGYKANGSLKRSNGVNGTSPISVK